MRTCDGVKFGLGAGHRHERAPRKAVTLCLGIALASTAAFAEFEVGGRAALPVAWMGGDGWDEGMLASGVKNGVKVGMSAGVFGAYRAGDVVAIGIEVLVSSLGGAVRYEELSSGYSATVTLSQTMIELPLFARVMIGLPFGSLGLWAGPELMVPLDSGTATAKETYGGQTERASVDAQLEGGVLFAVAAGVDVHYPLGPGFLIGGVRLAVSVTADADETKRNALALTAGYGIKL